MKHNGNRWLHLSVVFNSQEKYHFLLWAQYVSLFIERALVSGCEEAQEW